MRTGDWGPSLGALLFLGCPTVGACGPGDPRAEPPGESGLAGLGPELARAIAAARDAVIAAPADTDARAELAMVLDANGLDDSAELAWVQLTELDPTDARAFYCLSRVRERRGDADGALSAVHAAAELAPDYAPAHARRGRLLLEGKRLEEAEAALHRSIELAPLAPRGYLALARLHLLRDEPAEAIRVLEPVLARHPQEPYLNALLARAWSRQGEEERASEHLAAEEEAGAPYPDDPWSAEVRGRTTGLLERLVRSRQRLSQGDASGALAELEPVRDRLDELPIVEALCQTYLALGRPEEVLEVLERSPADLRESYKLRFFRAAAHRDLGEPATSLELARRAVEANPHRPEAHALEGKLLFELGRLHEAIAALETALARGDGELSTRLYIARAHAHDGDRSKGRRLLEAAAADFPAAAKPWAYRAELLALDGDLNAARRSLAEAEARGLAPELIELVSNRLGEIAQELEMASH